LASRLRAQLSALRATNDQRFDMFFTGGGSDQGPYGSGLGLAICHGMVGAHGGRIEALAGRNGKGTTIAIHLPLHEPPGASDEPVSDERGIP